MTSRSILPLFGPCRVTRGFVVWRCRCKWCRLARLWPTCVCRRGEFAYFVRRGEFACFFFVEVSLPICFHLLCESLLSYKAWICWNPDPLYFFSQNFLQSCNAKCVKSIRLDKHSENIRCPNFRTLVCFAFILHSHMAALSIPWERSRYCDPPRTAAVKTIRALFKWSPGKWTAWIC